MFVDAGEPEESASTERRLLEELVVDNRDLERLEDLLSQFNIFEALGAVRQELRHSDFLAFLLDPKQSHGLGDVFAKKLLQRVLANHPESSSGVSPIDLDLWSLDGLSVQREWQNIDILLLDEPHRLAVIIENKIWSGEHSGQLGRYYDAVLHHYPGWSVIGLFLTPEGEAPSDVVHFLAVDYGLVCILLEGISDTRASSIGHDVITMIEHYTLMLRRHIVGEPEVAELCRRIYQKHQRAVDLIFEYRPDRQALMSEELNKLIAKSSDLVFDRSSKAYIHFLAKEWADIPALNEGNGWLATGRILLFEFANRPDSLKLKLIIGPGPQDTRKRIFQIAQDHPPLKPAFGTLYQSWNTIFMRTFLSSKSYDELNDEELMQDLLKHWGSFLKDDLPAIRAAIRPEEFGQSTLGISTS